MCIFRMPYSLSSILGLVFKWQINAVKERKKQFVAIRMSYRLHMHIQKVKLSYISMACK